MNRFFIISILFITYQAVLFGQQKDFKAALKNGKNNDGVYVAFPKQLTSEKYEKWLLKNKAYKIMSTKKDKYLIFGNYVECVAEICFLPVEEVAKYEKEVARNKKLEAFHDAVNIKGLSTIETMKKQLAVFRKYPDFTPQYFSVTINGETFPKGSDIRAAWEENKDVTKEFLSVFPEYRNDKSIRSQFLNSNSSSGTVAGFIELFQDYQMAEDHVYSTIKMLIGLNLNPRWPKEVIPMLTGHVDMTRILNLLIDHKSDSESELITKYIDYTGKKYFSKKNLGEYFVSTETYLQLIKEINGCTPLIQQRPKTAENIFQPFVSFRLKKDGVTVWQQLFSDFPDKKSEILSISRNQYVSQAYYSKRKWSPDISSAISDTRSTIGRLSKYIESQIPDSEGIQLAKQYLSEASSILNRYNGDLAPARSYEAALEKEVAQIRENIEDHYYRKDLNVPPYVTENRTKDRTDGYAVTIDGTIIVDCEINKDGKYFYLTDIINYSSVSDFVVGVMTQEIGLRDCWHCFKNSTSLMERGEMIVAQYKNYGIKQWYKINRQRRLPYL
jgi:hypothetical protein